MLERAAHIDFETYSEADLKSVGSYEYARHASTEILVLCYRIENGPVLRWRPGDDSPSELLNHVRGGHPVVAHNAAGFELLIWNFVGVRLYCWPELKIEQIRCTMAMAAAMNLPLGLEKCAAAVGISQQKDMKGSRVMLQLCKPRDHEPDGSPIRYTREEFPEKYEELERYCEQDVIVESELYPRLMPLSAAETKVFMLDACINMRGVKIDRKAAEGAIRISNHKKGEFNARIQKLTKGFVSTVNETGRFKQWIESEGVADVPGIAKADVVELLARPDIPANIREALELRKEAAKSSNAKLDAMVSGAGGDNRLRGIFQYHGAGTGRWAGRRVQPQNFPRGNLSAGQIEEVFSILGGLE